LAACDCSPVPLLLLEEVEEKENHLLLVLAEVDRLAGRARG